MDIITDQLPSVHILNQYWLTLIMVISMVLVASWHILQMIKSFIALPEILKLFPGLTIK